MNRALPVLDNLRIASPCSASWDDMVGDKRRRFCGDCEKNVYDLTIMTPVEIVELIERTEGKFCGRLYQRKDGRVLTDDCPVGVARLLRQAKYKTLRATAFVLTMVGAAAAYMFSERSAAVITKTVGEIERVIEVPEQPVPGGIMIDPALMGDIDVKLGEVEE